MIVRRGLFARHRGGRGREGGAANDRKLAVPSKSIDQNSSRNAGCMADSTLAAPVHPGYMDAFPYIRGG